MTTTPLSVKISTIPWIYLNHNLNKSITPTHKSNRFINLFSPIWDVILTTMTPPLVEISTIPYIYLITDPNKNLSLTQNSKTCYKLTNQHLCNHWKKKKKSYPIPPKWDFPTPNPNKSLIPTQETINYSSQIIPKGDEIVKTFIH